MKVLVTGASGFIGGYVVEELLARGYHPIAFDRYNKNNLPEGAEFFQGDITDEVAITEGIAHADGFIHLAGVLGTQETIKNPNPAAHTNILGGLNLFKAAAHYNVPGVNIAVGNHWMNNTYSITKSTMERFAKMFNRELGTNISIVRALNAYGPRQVAAPPYGPSKVKKIMPAFVNNALNNRPIEIYGDGKQVMDMIYVEDVAQVLVAALEHTMMTGPVDGDTQPIYEAGSGNDTTVSQIADVVIKATGSTGGKTFTKMRPGEPEHSIVLGNPDTLRGLDIRQFVTLEDGVHRTVRYFEQLNS